jgi:Na+(H+)/acetate symporter ActP
MSAASFLGIAGAGVHQRLLRPDLLGRLAGRLADHHVPDGRALRNLGRFTFADVASFGCSKDAVRTMAAIGW